MGGINGSVVDPGETMSFSLANQATDVVIDSFDAGDMNGDSVVNIDATLTAFDENDVVLANVTAIIDHLNPINISGILNVASMSRFDIFMIEDGLRIGSISFQEIINNTPEYSCTGFEPPLIEDDLSTVAVERLAISKKSKRVIAVKTGLVDADDNKITDLDIPVWKEPVINVLFNNNLIGDGLPGDSLLGPGNADSGNQFRFDPYGIIWIFNLGTKELKASGVYDISMTSADQSLYTINEASCTISFERK